ncbi:sialin isoform X2 [Copidosoma floridanum]|uniref:sialin isoform X2 n=1 Tax=Copidosoma floridanum TaxID=29053 RepID=UPI000C6F768A|nr:sialin isoform X2 [Copidosoma floridanum]
MVNNTEEGSRGGGLSARYYMAMMGSVGLAIIYGFKVNLSIAIVAMVNSTAVREMNLNKTILSHNATVKQQQREDGPFVWDDNEVGLILSMYFWGYIVSLMPGGMMAEYVSAKWVLNVSVFLNVVASLLMPIAAEIHYAAFLVMRVIQGIGGGISFPAVHVMVAKWAPPNERSVLASIAYAGTAIGTVIFLLGSGIIAKNLGWQWVFYIEGSVCMLWCLVWTFTIKDTPEQQTFLITSEEREYIMTSIGTTKTSHKMKLSTVPWFQIFKSPPFLAILFAHFCSNFGWYMFLIELPTFMQQILAYKLESNTWLSALPFFLMWIFTMILGKLLARMQDKNWISVTVSRKIGTLFSSAIPMFCLLGVTYTSDKNWAVVLMTIGIMCKGGMYCGFLANHIDLAPNFAGTLIAITNTVATIPGILVPLIVGKLTSDDHSIESWKVIFFMTVTLYVVEMLIYTMFGTGEEQPWNKVKSKDPERTEQTVPLKEARH